MELKYLYPLKTILDFDNYLKTSERLDYTQPTVTLQMQPVLKVFRETAPEIMFSMRSLNCYAICN